MSRVIADGLSKRATATTAEAEAGTADKYPDAAGVHAAFNQYGLGAFAPEVSDADLATTPGFYTLLSTAANSPMPGTASGILRVMGYQSVRLIQHYQSVSDGAVYVRGYTGTWSSWRKVYDQNSILGTVSQSAGVPTGAIIESGSNANGSYTRLADGTMICSGRLADSGTIAANGKYAPTITFPAPFSSIPAHVTASSQPSVSDSGYIGFTYWVESITTADQAAVNFINGSMAQVLRGAYWFAKGRWY